mgnify:CR=1 FL=1
MGIEDAFNSSLKYVDLVKLIRSIQRTEENIDCYRRGLESCNRMDCVWRDHFLKEPEGPLKVDSETGEHKKVTNPKQEPNRLHKDPELEGLR